MAFVRLVDALACSPATSAAETAVPKTTVRSGSSTHNAPECPAAGSPQGRPAHPTRPPSLKAIPLGLTKEVQSNGPQNTDLPPRPC